jgi:hypothetical protein
VITKLGLAGLRDALLVYVEGGDWAGGVLTGVVDFFWRPTTVFVKACREF